VDCQELAIRNSTFDGDVAQGVSAVDDGYGYGIGLLVQNSVGVEVSGNEIYRFQVGVFFDNSKDGLCCRTRVGFPL
jgi:nitrous oxidase accessory protein NosD